ncbi:hypothetical protein MEQ_06271 [Candida albicans P87]|nr:hypothetical protein MG1_06329 [Candida albicans GC75]KGU00581.1 hypothetical protein MEQ_06271 [Candida albicans P87]KGU20881.1 hypothetical protein MGM_06280 [Candida albicans P75063]KHC27843.1 hypothetical protein W5O_06324 [Candida albicans Ca6]KHC51620.1 hypothetical protein MGE_06268 [Candida albicans P75010]KHC59029.1 hypothetical protein MGI_06256 [Candida albicans P75016]
MTIQSSISSSNRSITPKTKLTNLELELELELEEEEGEEQPQEVQEINSTSFSSSTTFGLYDESDGDKAYLAKSKLIAESIQSIGFGKYQIGLFFVAGFGWLSDNAWPVATSLILPRLNEINGVHPPPSSSSSSPNKGPYLMLAQNLGLLLGAAFWSISSDIIGRKWAFNLTFLITGIWAIIGGSSPNFIALCCFEAFWSFGVGGNLPVDSAIFLEALPSSYQWLLTVMSAWWAIGQIVVNLISWGLIANFSCPTTDNDVGSGSGSGNIICYKEDNKGWRYFLFTMGGLTLLMFFTRFAFQIFESPRYYLARGDSIKTIETLEKIAKINGKTCPITIKDLQDIDELYDESELEKETETETDTTITTTTTKKNNRLIKEKLKKYNLSHVRQCFTTSKKMTLSIILVVWLWGVIGLAFPLYNAFIPSYLESRGDANKPLTVHETYRNTLIISILGIPGSLIGGILVELKIGRKGTLFLSLILTGIFLFGSTTAKTSNANLAWNCMFSFMSTIMYGVLYAYTPEVFYSQIRGTAIGLAASFNRIMGVFAPIIAIYADLTTSAPIFVSGALFIFAGILSLCCPYEPRGKPSY